VRKTFLKLKELVNIRKQNVYFTETKQYILKQTHTMKQFLLIFCLFVALFRLLFRKSEYCFYRKQYYPRSSVERSATKIAAGSNGFMARKTKYRNNSHPQLRCEWQNYRRFLPAANTYFPKVKAAADELTKTDETPRFFDHAGHK